ncbi:MAG: hypothetical protein HC796_10780 [Synechococcaceae cyanobacterium RL_1_2]|nr:hypothetical protein [Synechococcaceae cyanobacterium RL_1_2]
MEMILGKNNNEAFVRALLKAIEQPNPPGEPSRPIRVLVKDRELQFFLRGILQPLGIEVEFMKKLILIDQLIATFEQRKKNTLEVVGAHQSSLNGLAAELWKEEPWIFLRDSQIIKVEIKRARKKKQELFLCVMGQLGAEIGVVMYRNLEAFKDFRRKILATSDSFHEEFSAVESLEQIFLSQDCWFLNYEENDDDDYNPIFGSIHPYEGIRIALDESEAENIYGAIKGFCEFLDIHGDGLRSGKYDQTLTQKFKIPLPPAFTNHTLQVELETMPELYLELQQLESQPMAGEEDLDGRVLVPRPYSQSSEIQEDILPEGSIYSIGMLKGETALLLEEYPDPNKFYQSLFSKTDGMEIPLISIQTSLPKAKAMIKQLQELGPQAITIAEGRDFFSNTSYDLLMLKTKRNQFHLIGEFEKGNKQHQVTMKKWQRRCKQTRNYCILLISSGVTGKIVVIPK